MAENYYGIRVRVFLTYEEPRVEDGKLQINGRTYVHVLTTEVPGDWWAVYVEDDDD